MTQDIEALKRKKASLEKQNRTQDDSSLIEYLNNLAGLYDSGGEEKQREITDRIHRLVTQFPALFQYEFQPLIDEIEALHQRRSALTLALREVEAKHQAAGSTEREQQLEAELEETKAQVQALNEEKSTLIAKNCKLVTTVESNGAKFREIAAKAKKGRLLLQMSNSNEEETVQPQPTQTNDSNPGRGTSLQPQPIQTNDFAPPTVGRDASPAGSNSSESTDGSPIDFEIQHVVVLGTPFQRGKMHGEQARDKILLNLKLHQRTCKSLPPYAKIVDYITGSYMPQIQDLFPQMLEEMNGIAQGAGVGIADIIFLNARYEFARLEPGTFGVADDGRVGRTAAALGKVSLKNGELSDNRATRDGECTSMAYIEELDTKLRDYDANTSGYQVYDGDSINPGASNTVLHAYIGQNWDSKSWLYKRNTIIVLESHTQIEPTTGGDVPDLVTITLTEAGQLAGSGMNNMGLGICTNSLWSNEDGTQELLQQSLPFTLARRSFLECDNLSDGLRALCSFQRHTSSNVTVASSSGISMDLEMTPSTHFALHPTMVNSAWGTTINVLTHSNHFVSPAMQARPDIMDTYPGGASLFRANQLMKLILKDMVNNPRSGHMTCTVQTPGADHEGKKSTARSDTYVIHGMKKVLSDHAGYPGSICEHHGSGKRMTVASVIYDLRRLEMHVCSGNPCCGTWVTYNIRDNQDMSASGYLKKQPADC